MDSAAKLELAWKNERKWFSRTFVASFVSVVCFAACLGAFWWGNREVAKAAASIGGTIGTLTPEQEPAFRAATANVFAVTSGALLVLVISGLLFLFFLVRWILAFTARKKTIAEIERAGGKIVG